MNRRSLLTGAGTVTLAAAFPILEAVTAPLDPASDFVRRYIAAHDWFNENASDDNDDDWDRLAGISINVVHDELIEAMPVPTTDAGLRDVIRLMNWRDTRLDCGALEALAAAALAYIEGRASK